MLMVGSYIYQPQLPKSFVTDEISKSSRKFPSQAQKFPDESHRTGTLVNGSDSYLNCLVKDLGEIIRCQK